ncbi:unnamed protein product [Hermetia illucens]|uniref:Kelch-like protein diablo n=1 Tax=Hermetia illucens TaxID=343691 RepID=A0A7R8V114_HERIL|nr:unnamed protein product [Hermetia illucens]
MGSFPGERTSSEFEREELLLRKEYTDREHLISAFTEIKGLRDAEEFCDIILKVENREVKAHRVILAASSPYFKNAFSGQSLVTIAKFIELPQQRYEPIKSIIDYIYTGCIEVNLETAEELFKTADFLQINRVKDVCSHFLKAALSPESCLQVWNITGNIGLIDIQNEATKLSISTIDHLITSSAFLNLCPKKVEELLEKSTEIPRADKVYRAVLAWVKHDLKKRKPLLKDLNCMLWMHKIFVSMFDIVNSELSQEEDELMNHSSGHIYVSSLRGKYSTFYKFDTLSSEITDLPACSRVRYSHPVFYNEAIYFTGGLVKSGCSNKCDRFNVIDESWDVLTLDCDRYYHGACVVKDNLYVVGGCKDHQNLKTVKVYDFKTGNWTKAADMNIARKFFGIVKHNGCIYAIGGVTDKADSSSSVEMFDQREGIWQNIPALGKISGACTAAVASNQIYCSGFRSGFVERFETRMNRWTSVANAISLPGSLVSTRGELYRVSVDGIQHFESYNNCWNNSLDVNIFSTEIVAVAN